MSWRERIEPQRQMSRETQEKREDVGRRALTSVVPQFSVSPLSRLIFVEQVNRYVLPSEAISDEQCLV